MAVNTLETLSVENKTFYEKTLLKRLLPNLVYYKYAQKKPIPKREGDTVSFRRFNSYPVATTPLTEGKTPDEGQTLNITELKCTVKQYGDYTLISDKLDMLGIDPVITETSALHGEQAGLTIDTITRETVRTGTNVLRPNSRATTDAVTAADVLTSKEIKFAVRDLRKHNVKPAEGKFYIGIIDSDTALDLQNDPEWQDVSKYNGGQRIIDGEVGSLHGVKFIETSNVYAAENGSGVPVHHTVIFGANAFGVTEIEGKSKPKIIVKPHGSSGTDDPLDQRASIGWKALLGVIRLDELAIKRIEHACSVPDAE